MKRFLLSLVFLSLLIPVNSGQNLEKEHLISISTPFGDMLFVLYNDTPAHRDNFIKLINEGYYENALFNRVIKNFMIQGGESDHKKDYTIPAEIKKNHFHRRGALAAARKPDDENPEKRSSATQFYIVHGKKYKEKDLDFIEKYNNRSFTEEEKTTYMNLGGAAHLDGEYTIFGELIMGFEVIEAIANIETGSYNRPVKDIKMKVSILE